MGIQLQMATLTAAQAARVKQAADLGQDFVQAVQAAGGQVSPVVTVTQNDLGAQLGEKLSKAAPKSLHQFPGQGDKVMVVYVWGRAKLEGQNLEREFYRLLAKAVEELTLSSLKAGMKITGKDQAGKPLTIDSLLKVED